MNGYREFWNDLIFGNKLIFIVSLERYWITVGVFVALCVLVGVASLRVRGLAIGATLAIFAGYLASLVPFIAWTISCTGCSDSFDGEQIVFPRSEELVYLHMTWGGFFAMGVAALWITILLSEAVADMIERRSPPIARTEERPT